jgi:hypothetical protein
MKIITYVQGDCLASTPSAVKWVPHVCNDVGGYGSGFVAALNKRWPSPRDEYREWFTKKSYNLKGNSATKVNFELGQVQFVGVEPRTIICNMIGQHMTGSDENGGPCIRYLALANAMNRVRKVISRVENSEIHAPMFGSGLAGGNWEFIEALINELWCSYDIPVTIYKFD